MKNQKLIRSLATLFLAGSFFYSVASWPNDKKPIHPEPGINFLEGKWNAARQKAAAEHKYIFVDVYATWCSPCKQLEKTTFRNKEVADFFNSHFINVSLDVDKDEAVDLVIQWGIRSVPTLLIFDPSGQPVLKSLGYVDPANLMTFAKQALAKK